MVWSTPAGEVLIDVVTRPGQTDHGHGGGALAYGGKPAAGGVVAAPQPRAPPAAPYAQPYPPAQLRLHQPGYGSAALTYREGGYARSGGAVSEYRGGGGTRMSLLGTGYLPPPAPPAHHPPPADPPPFKKIRLNTERPSVTPLPHHQQLRIDTREPVNPYNTVEVLSPNPPSEPTIEDQNFRTTKDELLQQISKVDREMALSETTLTKLKKKAEELEQTASKPARAEEPEEAPPRHRSLAQCVYADNRKKVQVWGKKVIVVYGTAAQAHAMLSHLGPPVLYPLYNQPQDTEVYHENIRKHRGFRKRLAEHVRRLKLEAEKREDALAEAYSRRAAEWARRVERIEQGQKRKAKDARNREFFEKVFPELRKQREERERFNRLGARVKSEAELEEIADGLHEQEHEDKKMRSLTVVPPLLRDPRDTRPVYIDTNRRCMDMEAEHKELQLRNVWTQAEREIFKEKYLQHPKNFGLIASFLSRKSVRDCVRFYYLSKKSQNYKQLLRKPRQRRSQRSNAPRPAPEPELPAGVTTRLQRSQGTTARTTDAQSNVLDDSMTTAGGDVIVGEISCIPVPPDAPAPAAPAQPARSELTRTPPLPPSPPPASSAPPAPVTSTSSSVTGGSPAPAPTPPVSDTPLPATTAEAVITTTSLTSCASSPTPTVISTATTTVTVAVVTSAPPTPQLSQPPTPTQPPPTPETAVIERTGTPSSALPSITTTTITTTVSTSCAICKVSGATRAVTRSRVLYYGLREENAAGARVCEPCHCRCIRLRYRRCPVPTCPGPRVRAKRLRHLPPRWHDLSLELKRPLLDEFQIPSELSKCCLACFKRITRRLETIGESPPTDPTEEEASRFRTLLREHGTAWDRMSSACGRTPASLKAFYFTYRKKFQLDALVERAPQKGSDTDESLLSSGDTDTSSAESPRPPPPPEPAPPRHRRDEYDSSATETADEENDAPSTKQSLPPSTSSLPVSVPTSLPTSLPACSLPPNRNGPGTPLTVRDVVLNMIEISLMKSSQPNPPNKLHQTKVSSSNAPRESLATLSVVSSTHGSGGAAPTPRSPQRPATITPVAQPPLPAPDAPKEGVVVVIEPRPEPLLDLSVKRPRQDFAFPQHNKNTPYRNSTEYPTYRTQPERESPTQYNSKPKPVTTLSRPTLKCTNPKGSITLGTPVETRFDPRRTPPDPKTGSITAGTPVHGTHHLPEKRNFEYYKGRSPGGVYYAGATNQPRSQSPSYSPNTYGQHNRGSYGLEQRQIIAADFITSQQMHGGARRERTERPAERSASPQYSPRREREPVSVIQRHTPHVYPHPHPHPPPGGQYSPRRERELVSVIQRHTPHVYPHPHPHSPPGHEAFTSLVDVASAAPALPVPREPKPEPKHDIRIQERMQRDMAMQKYHQQQIQFQVLERDRRAQQQAQYIERDRQMAMQSRERDRALAAIQERHMPMDHPQHPHAQHQGQMMHERHHLQHSQQSVSSAESDRRMLAPAYTVAKHRPLAPHILDRKDIRPAAPAVCGGAVVSAGAVGTAAAGQAQAGGPRPAEGKLTAATLIDAIITHQISQNSTDQRFQQTIRREDAPAPAPPPQQDRGVVEEGHTTSIKLGDLASNIIVRDYCSPTASLVHHNSNYNAPKHVPYLEPVSPPDNHHANRNNSNRRYSGVPSVGVGVSGGGGVLTAFDYVTNRIVEVMRSDADERKPPLAFPTTPYAYPYSALNVATPTADATGSTGGAPAAAPAPAAPVAPEPAPLMSAQYEPLSDED